MVDRGDNERYGKIMWRFAGDYDVNIGSCTEEIQFLFEVRRSNSDKNGQPDG